MVRPLTALRKNSFECDERRLALDSPKSISELSVSEQNPLKYVKEIPGMKLSWHALSQQSN